MIARSEEGVIAVPPLRGYISGCAPEARPRRTRLDDYGDLAGTTPGYVEAFGREPAPMPADEDVGRSPT